jgi:hypothetical protein
MSDPQLEFNRGVVRPGECLSEGWALIKGHYWQFLGITFVATLIGSAAPFAILMGPMWCGVYICLFRRMAGRPVKFDMLFRGFEYFVPSLIATLVMVVPMMVVLGLGYVAFLVAMFASLPGPAGPGAPPPPGPGTGLFVSFGLFFLLVFVVMTVAQVLFFFIYPLIVERKMTGMQAVRASLRAARGNFGGVLGLTILTMLLTWVGLLACYVGAIFVTPIHFAAVAVAYRKVFPGEYQETRYRDERGDFDDQVAEDPGRPDDEYRRE